MSLLLLFRPRSTATTDTHDGADGHPKKIYLPIYEDTIKKKSKRKKRKKLELLKLPDDILAQELREKITKAEDDLVSLQALQNDAKDKELADLLAKIARLEVILAFLKEEEETLLMLTLLV